MASTYDVGRDYGLKDGDDYLQMNPAWVLAVVRFKRVHTFSRHTFQSVLTDTSEATIEAGPPLVITDDCLALNVGNPKGSHLKTLSAVLIESGQDYLAKVLPGDWLLAWMVNSEEQRDVLVERIRTGKRCNHYEDGLKFVGQVYSVFEDEELDQGAGVRTLRYQLMGNGFTPLDSAVFYDPHLANTQLRANEWLQRLGLVVNDIIRKDSGIDINKIIPSLVDVLLGRGISQALGNPANDPRLQAIAGSTTGQAANEPFAYVVPSTVGKLLGRQSRIGNGATLAYADLLDGLYGVQRYTALGPDFIGSPGVIFQPNGTRETPNRYRTTHELMGLFLPAIPQFTGKSVWAILSQYLNPVINEMYTALRANEQDEVVPTLVVRQLPFSSPFLAEQKSNVTPFLELPRWKVPPLMVLKRKVGRSDAMRFNFEHLTGQGIAQRENGALTHDLARNPPISDTLDINRHGLRMDMQVVSCDLKSQMLGPRHWQEVRSDFLFGGHLLLAGTMVCMGIQSPIAEGDNLEHNGVVYHIESVTHSCGMQGERKFWVTTLQLSHGVRSDTELSRVRTRKVKSETASYLEALGLDLDSSEQMYAGLREGDRVLNHLPRTVDRKE